MIEPTLLKMLLAILGATVMIWANAARKGERFNAGKWLEENSDAIIFTVAGIGLMSMVYTISPQTLESVKTISGLSLADTETGWFTFGALLYEGLRKSKRTKSK